MGEQPGRTPDRFLVIGAGASGLCTAKVLLETGPSRKVIIVDDGTRIGGTYVNKTYEGSRLVSSTYLTCFSDYRRPNADEHMTTDEYTQYLEDYASDFGLCRHIRFRTRVVAVRKPGDVSFETCYEKAGKVGPVKRHPEGGPYLVELEDLSTGTRSVQVFDAVAVCSGLHNYPRVPTFPGQSAFRGLIMHSSEYKGPSHVPSRAVTDSAASAPCSPPTGAGAACNDAAATTTVASAAVDASADAEAAAPADVTRDVLFANRRVLILGNGETAFDVAFAAASAGAKAISLVTRHGFVSVPANFPGTKLPPLDCLIMNVGTHGYEALAAKRGGLHWLVTTKLQRMGLLLMGGSSFGLNQWAGRRFNMSWDLGNKHIVNKSARAMGLINRGPKARAPFFWRLLNRLLYSGWDAASAGLGPKEGVVLLEGVQVKRFETDGESVTFAPIPKRGATAVNAGTAAIAGSASSAGSVEGAESEETRVPCDLVILATGYAQRFPFLANGDSPAPASSASASTASSTSSVPSSSASPASAASPPPLLPSTASCAGEDPLPSEHFVLDPWEPRLAFVGFVRPNVGAIPPMAELQARWWCTRLQCLAARANADQSADQSLDRNDGRNDGRNADQNTDKNTAATSASASASASTSASRLAAVKSTMGRSERARFRALRWRRLAGGGGRWRADGSFEEGAGGEAGPGWVPPASDPPLNMPVNPTLTAPMAAPSHKPSHTPSHTPSHLTSSSSACVPPLPPSPPSRGDGGSGRLAYSYAMPGPHSCALYRLPGSRLDYAVDYGTYMFALAREMGAEPRLTRWLFRNPKVFAAAAFGQAHAPLFRLDGPFASPDAPEVCANELLGPVVRRPLFMNAAFAANALGFGLLNALIALASRAARYTVDDFAHDLADLTAEAAEYFLAR